ncbi:MAG: hypothetical protein M3Z20_02645 [Chloroflexota bacterium]|nr:hypothetical protein [Chloroflexota bacterium]
MDGSAVLLGNTARFAVTGVIADQPIAAGRRHTPAAGFVHLAARPARLGFVAGEAQAARDIGAGFVVGAAVGALTMCITEEPVAAGVLVIAVSVHAPAILACAGLAEGAIAAGQAKPEAVATVLPADPTPPAVSAGVACQTRAAGLPVEGVAPRFRAPADHGWGRGDRRNRGFLLLLALLFLFLLLRLGYQQCRGQKAREPSGNAAPGEALSQVACQKIKASIVHGPRPPSS